jgi:hypothetical protein
MQTTEKAVKEITVKLNFLNEYQLNQILKMFDSEEAYCKNYPPLKAICSGLHEFITRDQKNVNPKIRKMFQAINSLQGSLILKDVTKWIKINDDWHRQFSN